MVRSAGIIPKSKIAPLQDPALADACWLFVPNRREHGVGDVWRGRNKIGVCLLEISICLAQLLVFLPGCQVGSTPSMRRGKEDRCCGHTILVYYASFAKHVADGL